MSNGQRIPLGDARALARRFTELMKISCEDIQIAGSIRRRKQSVGDIEVVVIPKIRENRDMFGELRSTECQLSQMVSHLAEKGVLAPRLNKNAHNIAWNLNGTARYIAGIYKNFAVDIFIVRPDRQAWHGYRMVERTGPGDANRLLVTEREYGGLKPAHVYINDGQVWSNHELVELPTEQDVFDLWNMDYVEPWDRTVLNYRKALKTKTTG